MLYAVLHIGCRACVTVSHDVVSLILGQGRIFSYSEERENESPENH